MRSQISCTSTELLKLRVEKWNYLPVGEGKEELEKGGGKESRISSSVDLHQDTNSFFFSSFISVVDIDVFVYPKLKKRRRG